MTNPSENTKKTIAYDELKKRILGNVLKPGDPLTESALTREFQISKTPVREAIQQLEKEGFIENVPGKGAFVSRVSLRDIREIFEVREIFEPEVIKRVAASGKIDLAEVEAIRKEFESAQVEGREMDRAYYRLGERVHSFILESFGNSRLLEFSKRLEEHVERIVFHFFSDSSRDRTEQARKEHLEILEAIVARDPIRAEKAMRDHLRNAKNYQRELI